MKAEIATRSAAMGQIPRKGAPRAGVGEWLAVALITGGAALLCLRHLAAKSFWFDEGASVGIARLDWYNFVRLLWRREGNMSLYYLMLRGWLHWGGSEAFIRGLSVIFAVAAVPPIFFLGRKLFSTRVGLTAAVLLTVNAYNVRYAQEARAYSLMLFLCTLSSLYFVKALREPSRANRIAYVAISALAVYAHFYSGLLVVAQWASLRFLNQDEIPQQIRKDWRWFACAVAPIAAFVATTGAGPLRWIQRLGLPDLWQFGLHLSGNGGPVLLGMYVVACAAGALPKWSNAKRVKWEAWRFRFLALWLLLPVMIALLVSFARPLFLARYFIFCLPALLLLAAAGVARLRRVWLIAPVLAVFVVLSLRGTFSYYQHDFDLGRNDWRAASTYVLSHAQPGDAVLFHVAMGRMSYEYYRGLERAAGPAVLYPNHGDRITFRDFLDKPEMARLGQQLPGYSRVWLVLSNNGGPDNPDPTTYALEKLIQQSHPAEEVWGFPWIEVELYQK